MQVEVADGSNTGTTDNVGVPVDGGPLLDAVGKGMLTTGALVTISADGGDKAALGALVVGAKVVVTTGAKVVMLVGMAAVDGVVMVLGAATGVNGIEGLGTEGVDGTDGLGTDGVETDGVEGEP